MQRARALFTYSRCIAVEFYDGFEFCVYSRAPAKINRKFAHLRWACDGPAKDFKTSDFSEISFLNPSQTCAICDGYWLFATDLKLSEIGPCSRCTMYGNVYSCMHCMRVPANRVGEWKCTFVYAANRTGPGNSMSTALIKAI